MVSTKVAKRYAQGLLEFATETNAVQPIFGEMKDVVKLMNESKELNSFFATPFIEAKRKQSVANQICIFYCNKKFYFLNHSAWSRNATEIYCRSIHQ